MWWKACRDHCAPRRMGAKVGPHRAAQARGSLQQQPAIAAGRAAAWDLLHWELRRVNWINNVVLPEIRNLLTNKRELPDTLWVKCPDSGQMVFYKDLEANQFVIPSSNYHMRMDARQRLQLLFDGGKYNVVPVREVAQDPLKFRDGKRY